MGTICLSNNLSDNKGDILRRFILMHCINMCVTRFKIVYDYAFIWKCLPPFAGNALTGHRWIPTSQMDSKLNPWCFCSFQPECTFEQNYESAEILDTRILDILGAHKACCAFGYTTWIYNETNQFPRQKLLSIRTVISFIASFQIELWLKRHSSEK